MAKETPIHEESVQQESEQPKQSLARVDNKPTIIAVGAAVILFIVGIILGYLLGRHNTSRDTRMPMDNNGSYRMFERGSMRTNLQPQQNTNGATSSQSQ